MPADYDVASVVVDDNDDDDAALSIETWSSHPSVIRPARASLYMTRANCERAVTA